MIGFENYIFEIDLGCNNIQRVQKSTEILSFLISMSDGHGTEVSGGTKSTRFCTRLVSLVCSKSKGRRRVLNWPGSDILRASPRETRGGS